MRILRFCIGLALVCGPLFGLSYILISEEGEGLVAGMALGFGAPIVLILMIIGAHLISGREMVHGPTPVRSLTALLSTLLGAILLLLWLLK